MTPFKRAMDNFKESDEWHESTDPTTLGATERQRVYLENRLQRAFACGWNARFVIVPAPAPIEEARDDAVQTPSAGL